MKKILFFSLLSLLAFAACKPDKPGYVITGTVTGELNGKTVVLKSTEDLRPTTTVDSAVIDKGAFTLKGNVATPDYYIIMVEGANIGTALFLENAPIQVTLDVNEPKNNKAFGSPLNDLYAQYATIRSNFNEQNKEFRKNAQEKVNSYPDKKLPADVEKQLDSTYNKLNDDYKAAQMKFMNDNPNSIVTAYILRTVVSSLTPEEIEPIVSKFDTIVGKSAFAASVKENLAIMKKVAVGEMFTDIKLPNPEGKEIALSDYAGKGKIVLVDFWASWCGPCRAENPKVVALYNKYKNKGFEIVGISLDSKKEDWAKGIADDKITWPQMSDLQQWNSIARKLYNINSIPSTMLLDKDGKILAKNLHGEELAAKLAELLDAKK